MLTDPFESTREIWNSKERGKVSADGRGTRELTRGLVASPGVARVGRWISVPSSVREGRIWKEECCKARQLEPLSRLSEATNTMPYVDLTPIQCLELKAPTAGALSSSPFPRLHCLSSACVWCCSKIQTALTRRLQLEEKQRCGSRGCWATKLGRVSLLWCSRHGCRAEKAAAGGCRVLATAACKQLLLRNIPAGCSK